MDTNKLTPEAAYNYLASIVEQNLGMGNFKTFMDINAAQQALGLVKDMMDANKQQSAMNGKAVSMQDVERQKK